MWYFARRKSINFVDSRFHTGTRFFGDRTRVSLRSFEVRSRFPGPASEQVYDLCCPRENLCTLSRARLTSSRRLSCFLIFADRGVVYLHFYYRLSEASKCVDASAWSLGCCRGIQTSATCFNWHIDRSTVDRLTEMWITSIVLFVLTSNANPTIPYSLTIQLTPFERKRKRIAQQGSPEPVQIPMHSRNFSHINHRAAVTVLRRVDSWETSEQQKQQRSDDAVRDSFTACCVCSTNS